MIYSKFIIALNNKGRRISHIYSFNVDCKSSPYMSIIVLIPHCHFKEIELKRGSSNPGELLGLTLCYEDEDEEGNTEIFIDDIHPEGLAAKDGRLRLGDQIIQVGGRKITRLALIDRRY